MQDILSNIRKALIDDGYFDTFVNCDGDYKIFKDQTANNGELPFITIELDDRECNLLTGIEFGYMDITIHGSEFMRPDMYDIACELKDIFCNLQCLPECGGSPKYNFMVRGKIMTEDGYNPATEFKTLTLSFPIRFSERLVV